MSIRVRMSTRWASSLYELLTGVTPLDFAKAKQAGYAEVQRIICEVDPPTPSTRISSFDIDSSIVAEQRATEPRLLMLLLRGDLDVIVMKALEKDRSRRYRSPEDFSDDIRRFLHHEPIEARAASVGYRLKRLYQRNKLAVISGSLIGLLLFVGTVTSTALAIRAIRAERQARVNLTQANVERDRALEAEELAEAKEQKATLALEDAEAVMSILSDVFKSPDPTRDGETITVVEMLDREAARLDTELAPTPRSPSTCQDSYRRHIRITQPLLQAVAAAEIRLRALAREFGK